MEIATQYLVEGYTFEELTRTPGFSSCVKEYVECAPVAGAGLNRELYEELNREGRLEVFRFVRCSRDDDGKPRPYLLGFMVLLLTKSSHYPKGILSTDSIFVRKDYRKYGGFARLLGAARNAARGLGLPGFTIQAPKDSTLDRVMQHYGPELYRIFWLEA